LQSDGNRKIVSELEEAHVGETLLQFQMPVSAPDGTLYEARACGSPTPGGTWQGWIEFVPVSGGVPVRSPRETTQPNRTDTEYWATGLTEVYLEGALRRALEKPIALPMPLPQPSMFAGPAPSAVVTPVDLAPASVLDPFSVYEKGEALLRNQLAALSAWHLVNIAVEYELTQLDVDTLNRLPAAELIELIVQGVRQEIDSPRPA
jgi:hypothetical protein